jgi:hypothetical protein
MRKRDSLAIVLCGITLAAAFLVFQYEYRMNSRTEEAKPPVSVRMDNVGVSFEIPGSLEELRLAPSLAVFGDRTTLSFLTRAEATIIKSRTGILAQTIDEFVLDAARDWCSARSEAARTWKLDCMTLDTFVSIRPFESDYGVSGQVFYLIAERRDVAPGRADNVRIGPFYTFNTSDKTPNQLSFLMIYAPVSVRAEDANEALVRGIARSVRIDR